VGDRDRKEEIGKRKGENKKVGRKEVKKVSVPQTSDPLIF
jgi:hypothetical protein